MPPRLPRTNPRALVLVTVVVKCLPEDGGGGCALEAVCEATTTTPLAFTPARLLAALEPVLRRRGVAQFEAQGFFIQVKVGAPHGRTTRPLPRRPPLPAARCPPLPHGHARPRTATHGHVTPTHGDVVTPVATRGVAFLPRPFPSHNVLFRGAIRL